MSHHVIVSFGKGQEYDYKFAKYELGGRTSEEGRRWFDQEFQRLNCEISSPTGKILIIDKILNVAKYAGTEMFTMQEEWGNQFARYAALVLGRDLVRVDVAANSLGY